MNKHLNPFDRMCDPEALKSAWKYVRSGRVAAGVDQITLAEYARDLESNLESLAARVREGRYYPLPVRTIEIRKTGGGTRRLGIYTIEDSILQRAAKDALEPLFESSFLDCSFGFRPGRNVPMAVKQVLDYRAAGDACLVDADIADCFGSLDHDILMKLFSARIRDKRFQALIRMWLDTGLALPKPDQQAAGGLYDRTTGWLSDSVEGAVSHLLSESRFGAYGYGYSAVDPYGTAMPEDPQAAEESHTQARKEALKRLGSAGLLWALTYASRVRKLMSPTALVLTGAAVLTAAAAPAVSRAVRRRLGADDQRLHGVVQGGATSALLANLYLHELDLTLTKAGLHLVRYADDFVICCRDETSARRAMEVAAQKLAELRLRLHPQKTRIIRFDAGLEFLGYRFDQFQNAATPISPKNTSPAVAVLQAVKEHVPAALIEARDKAAPVIARFGQRAAQQVKDKAGRLSALLSRRRKGSNE